MNRTSCVVVALAWLIAPVQGLAQAGWFPANAQEGMARELADRLAASDLGIEEARLLPAARDGVAALKVRLESIGEKKLMEIAPRLARLELPAAGQAHLDAMARLGMCTFYLDARFANPADADGDARLDAAMGPMALALSTMYLRHFYLAGGGTDAAIKDHLAGDAANAVAFAVQRDPELLAYSAGECRAIVSALLDG